MTASAIDQAKLNETTLVIIGDRLGLYRAGDSKPITSQELADKTNSTERYIGEWLANQAGVGYIRYDTATGKYTLPPEHVVIGGFQLTSVLIEDESKIGEAFRTRNGVDWGDHDPSLYVAVERVFKDYGATRSR